MITTIIGPPGSGKSTISKLLAPSYDLFFEADKVVADLYNLGETISFFKNYRVLASCVKGGKIIKDDLIVALLSYPLIKTELEDYIFKIAFAPIINAATIKGQSLLIDGMLPRFSKYFDQVIRVDVSQETSYKHLLNRGVSEQRAKALLALGSMND